jgi:hypothetical protein
MATFTMYHIIASYKSGINFQLYHLIVNMQIPYLKCIINSAKHSDVSYNHRWSKIWSLSFVLAVFDDLLKRAGMEPLPLVHQQLHILLCSGSIPEKIHDWWPVERLEEGKKYATLASLQAD